MTRGYWLGNPNLFSSWNYLIFLHGQNSKTFGDWISILHEHPKSCWLNDWLVVYLPLWKIWKSVGITIPNIWNNKKCSKPPTKSYWFRVLHSHSSKLVQSPGPCRLSPNSPPLAQWPVFFDPATHSKSCSKGKCLGNIRKSEFLPMKIQGSYILSFSYSSRIMMPCIPPYQIKIGGFRSRIVIVPEWSFR